MFSHVHKLFISQIAAGDFVQIAFPSTILKRPGPFRSVVLVGDELLKQPIQREG